MKKIEIDQDELRATLLWLIDQIYAARHEVVAYGVALHFLEQAGLAEGFDQVLQRTRLHPSPALLADHQKARDTVAALLRESSADKLLSFLQNWKPEGPTQ